LDFQHSPNTKAVSVVQGRNYYRLNISAACEGHENMDGLIFYHNAHNMTKHQSILLHSGCVCVKS